MGIMNGNHDFRDLLQCLNEAGARYLIVGAYAVIFHTEPRYTRDLDIWTDPTPENARKIWNALVRFGAPLARIEGEAKESFVERARNAVIALAG